ncbi:MAG: PQQ-binding-like beta-propeller repeat protein [Ignavibacteriaceae bacterium]
MIKNRQTILLFFLILINFHFSLSQTINFAVIADPLIGVKNSETNLKGIINQVNERDDLDFVIIFGSISTDGSYTNLNIADNLLYKLDIPFYVAPGINDISKALNGGVDYLQSIGGDGFSFNFSDEIFLSINPFIPFNQHLYRINIDERKWIDDFISSSGLNNVFIFCPVTPSEISNLENMKSVLGKIDNTLFFTPAEKQYSREIFENTNLIKLPSVSENELSYNIIKLENDTVYIFKRLLTEKSDLLIDQFERKPGNFQPVDIIDVEVYSDQVKIKKIIPFNETHHARVNFNDNLIYTASKSGTINAINKNGIKQWEYYTGGTIFYSPVRYKDILAAAIFESDLITLNANNGDVLQIIGLSENISSPLALIDINHNGYDTKGIIVTTISGAIYCYELFSLELVWTHKSNKGRINAPPLEVSNMIIFNNRNGEVFALNTISGTLIWKWKIPGNADKSDSFAAPVSDGKNVYILFDENIIAAIDLLQGTQRWININIPHQHAFAILDEEQILIKGRDNNYIIVSSVDGKLVRSFPSLSRNYFPDNFVQKNNYIFNGTSEGDIVLIDKDLKVTALFNSYNAPIVSIAAIDDDSFVSLDIDGNLIIFEITETKEN